MENETNRFKQNILTVLMNWGPPGLPRSNVTALSLVSRLKLLALGKDLVLLSWKRPVHFCCIDKSLDRAFGHISDFIRVG